MLQAANTNLFNPLSLKLTLVSVKVNLMLNWWIFIFGTIGINGLNILCLVLKIVKKTFLLIKTVFILTKTMQVKIFRPVVICNNYNCMCILLRDLNLIKQ